MFLRLGWFGSLSETNFKAPTDRRGRRARQTGRRRARQMGALRLVLASRRKTKSAYEQHWQNHNTMFWSDKELVRWRDEWKDLQLAVSFHTPKSKALSKKCSELWPRMMLSPSQAHKPFHSPLFYALIHLFLFRWCHIKLRKCIQLEHFWLPIQKHCYYSIPTFIMNYSCENTE